MGATAISAGSSISFDEQQVIIRLDRKLFTPWRWELVTGLILHLQQFMAGVRDEGASLEGASRLLGRLLRRPWRHSALDVLSQLLYLLLIPRDHFLVRLDQEIDLSFVDEECADCGKWRPGKPGRPPWPAQLMFRLLLLMFLFGVPYETQLVLELQANLLWRWFIGLGVLEKVPDHSTLHDFRKRLGPERFVRLLARILVLCQEWGLVDNLHLYFDCTAVLASATAFTPYQRAVLLALAINRYLDLLEGQQVPDPSLVASLRQLVVEVALEAVGSDSLKKVSPEQIAKSLGRWEEKAEAMAQGPHWQEPVTQAVAAAAAEETPPTDRQGLLLLAQRLLDTLPRARGDLDAQVGKANNWLVFCGYLAGYVVDGLFGIITAMVFAAGNAWQAALLSPALAQHQTHIAGQAQDMTIDSAFDYPEVYLVLEAAELKGYIASRDHRSPEGRFGPDRFTWTKEGRLICPRQGSEGEMKPVRTYADGRVTYQGVGCADCPLRGQCVGDDKSEPRSLTIHPQDHRRWLANRAANQSEEHKQAQKRRMAWENVFGHGNTYHHGDKAPYRSQPMNEIAEVMTVIAVNLEKMVRYGKQRQPLQAGTPA
jgi:transposase